MSKVVIQGNASGTGDFTIAAPNSNTDRTLTLPDETGELVVKGQIISTAKDTDFTAYSSSNTNGVLNNNNNTSFTPQRSDTTVLVFVTLWGRGQTTGADDDLRPTFKVGTVNSSGSLVFGGNTNSETSWGYVNLTTTANYQYNSQSVVINGAEKNSSGNVVVQVYGFSDLDTGTTIEMSGLEAVFMEVLL